MSRFKSKNGIIRKIREKKHRAYSSYYDYKTEVVDKCGHKWLILESDGFRNYQRMVETTNKFKIIDDDLRKLPKGELVKITPAKCHSYSCPVCGKKKVLDLVAKLKSVDLTKYRFFTLTLKNRMNLDNSEMNLKRVSDCYNKLNNNLRKKKQYKGLEYFRVTEIGKDGMVHIHGIWNKYIPTKELSEMWLKITKDSYIVKVERIKNKKDAVNYLFKYLTKDIAKKDYQIEPSLMNMDLKNSAALFYETGKRRHCSSRGFFPKVEKKKAEWKPRYFEANNEQTVESLLQYFVDRYKLKPENVNFDYYYGSEQFLYELFRPDKPPPDVGTDFV